jgi:cytochrome c oxidase subunit 3
MEAADTASSYLYLITFLHLLHVIVTTLYIVKLVRHSFSGKINKQQNLTLQMGAIFWHFLGLLWIYLVLFLLFIH